MSKPAVQEKPQRPVDMQQKKTAEGMTALMEELQPEMPAAPQKEPPKEPLTPEKMYEEARGFITQADYTKARGALATFVEKHPNHPLVPAAFYWTGETYFVEKNYGAAAKQFLDGYKKDPKGSKAADNLLKLALSLENMGKKKEACATVKKLLKTGTKMNGSIRSVAERLQERLNCGSK